MVNNKKIGLALGGGGARGFAHIGILKILEQEGIRPDFIVGVSMGALIGACYASGLSILEIEKEALSLTKAKAMRELMDLSNPYHSLLKGRKARKFIKKLIGDPNFSETKIPFYVIATDLCAGQEKIFHEGSIVDAICASVSVPGIFPPVKIGEDYYIDGGVVNPTPVNVIEKLGADVIIGVDLIMKKNIKLDKPGLVATLMQAYEIIRTQAVKFNLNHSEKNTILIMPEVRDAIDSFKFYNIDKFIKSGEEAALAKIKEIKKLL